VSAGTYRLNGIVLRVADAWRFRFDKLTAQLSRRELPEDGTQCFRLESDCGRYGLVVTIDGLMGLEVVQELAS
jgi:hypothetical protein